MEHQRYLDRNDYLAIGLATVSFVTVENHLRGAWALDSFWGSGGDRTKIEQKRFQKSFKKNLSELSTWLKHHPKIQSLPSEDRNNLGAFLDGFVVWRNTLFHGRYLKKENGNILLSFHDHESWDTADKPGSILGPITKEFAAQELLDVVQTNDRFLASLRETLGVCDITETTATNNDRE